MILPTLFLDDEEARHIAIKKQFETIAITSAYTADECIYQLAHNRFQAALLDYDLKEGTPSGIIVARWMAQHPDRCPHRIIIHSLNVPGARNMQKVLPNAVYIPFCKIVTNFEWA